MPRARAGPIPWTRTRSSICAASKPPSVPNASRRRLARRGPIPGIPETRSNGECCVCTAEPSAWDERQIAAHGQPSAAATPRSLPRLSSGSLRRRDHRSREARRGLRLRSPSRRRASDPRRGGRAVAASHGMWRAVTRAVGSSWSSEDREPTSSRHQSLRRRDSRSFRAERCERQHRGPRARPVHQTAPRRRQRLSSHHRPFQDQRERRTVAGPQQLRANFAPRAGA
jgi:hypothetical protein